jgi:hypothetical protein
MHHAARSAVERSGMRAIHRLSLVASIALALLVALAASGPGSRAGPSVVGAGVRGPASAARAATAPVTAPFAASAPGSAAYPWHPRSTDPLDVRLSPPRGFVRVAVDGRSFGAFLRALPLLAAGTPVVDYAGRVVREGSDPNIAAVVDIDVGASDLQQCADAVVRMNAEWHYGRGDRDVSYRIASGVALTYEQYLAGSRAFARGNELLVQPAAARLADDHRAFRRYLDEVFTWLNTSSLERDGAPVAWADLRPGDFFVMSGRPFGHAVLVLDVAMSEAGAVALLLGQSYMPAQRFQVLGSSSHGAWFVVEPGATEVATPFWKPFPVTALRRLP